MKVRFFLIFTQDLISENNGAIAYTTTVTADNTGTVTDTATIMISGEATKVIFPQRDRSGLPPPPRPSHETRRMKDILLGVFLGAGLVLLFVACLFGYRAYKRKKNNRELTVSEPHSDSEQPQQLMSVRKENAIVREYGHLVATCCVENELLRPQD